MWSSDHTRVWLEQEGAGIWVEYLLTHPSRLLAPATKWKTLNDPVQFTDPRDPLLIRDRWPGPHRIMAMSILVVGLSVLLAVRAVGWDRRLGVPLFLLGSVIPHHFMVSHAVPIETPRHGVLMAFTLVLGLVWAVAVAVDIGSDSPLRREVGTQRCAFVGR